MNALLDWLVAHTLTSPLVVVPIAVLAYLATRVSRLVIRRIIRHVALASLRAGRMQSGLWRTRIGRAGGETGETGEDRRRQRIDAASRMVNHLVSLGVWIVAAIVTFHVLALDPAFFLSSAGFLGAGLAIGGQHKVNDYLSGLIVHFEDRYGIGDELVGDVGWESPVHGIVDHIGLFSTRLREAGSTVHVPNHALTSVRNLSQEAPLSTLRVKVSDDAGVDVAAATLRDLAGSDGLTDVVFVGDLAVRHDTTGEIEVDVWTSRALDGKARHRLESRAETALRDRRATR